MPLGDPQGGLFEYTDEGLPEAIHACVVPVSDVTRAIGFYTEILGMDLLHSDSDSAYLQRSGCRLILRRSNDAGGDTGIFIGVANPYDTRRRLMDEGVVFVDPPERTPFGTATSIRDDDGNVLHFIEMKGGFKPPE
jgi:catechol 2,3-dioxygenase-like lactoylglutathione lyase family enzyme